MVAVEEAQQVENVWLEEETQRKQKEEVTSQVEEMASHVVKEASQMVIAKGMVGGLVEGVLQEAGQQVAAST
jgi:hypothetical protein